MTLCTLVRGPAFAVDLFDFMGADQADYVVVLDDDEAAAAGPQQVLVDEVL